MNLDEGEKHCSAQILFVSRRSFYSPPVINQLFFIHVKNPQSPRGSLEGIIVFFCLLGSIASVLRSLG